MLTHRFLAICRRTAVACCTVLFPLVNAPGANVVAAPAGDVIQPNTSLVPDPQIQAQIQKLLYSRSAEERFNAFHDLAEKGGPNHEKLIPQLFYFSVHGTDSAGKHDVREAMALAGFANIRNIPFEQIAVALVPYWEINDAKARGELHHLFRGLPSRVVQDALQRHAASGKRLPQDLMARMYRGNPGGALLSMVRGQCIGRLEGEKDTLRRQLLLAEHVVSDTLWKHEHGFLDKQKVEPEAAAQIEKAAGDKQWWVRLYAAEIMSQHPAFRKPELLQKLAKDENALVRESANAALDAPKPNRPPDKSPPSYPSSKASKK